MNFIADNMVQISSTHKIIEELGTELSTELLLHTASQRPKSIITATTKPSQVKVTVSGVKIPGVNGVYYYKDEFLQGGVYEKTEILKPTDNEATRCIIAKSCARNLDTNHMSTIWSILQCSKQFCEKHKETPISNDDKYLFISLCSNNCRVPILSPVTIWQTGSETDTEDITGYPNVVCEWDV
jgi:hypothetical protein